MSPEDAEEYTQSLGQIMAGSWRQIAWAQRQGIPAALGVTTEAWVQERLGGYVRLSIPERREAVRELTAPVAEGGNGFSTRQAADVLGVDHKTVVNDQHAGEHSPPRRAIPEEAPPAIGEYSPPDDTEQWRSHRIATTRLLLGAVVALDPGSWFPEERAGALLSAFDTSLIPEARDVTATRLRGCAGVLDALIEHFEEEERSA
jgi:hypothetical protein